jgi:hypothetical protein
LIDAKDVGDEDRTKLSKTVDVERKEDEGVKDGLIQMTCKGRCLAA